eukprot:TRINITY_DN16698_c0_g1_i1.p2 TRINITY_DN16698_c0_g1~~TRINITY_DN16698_c0_g1_i1.p2  ORF type:complete len:325 (+),score=-76.68 TRINITY_DN16698_c0_g1_i1:2716-3690(+)
MLSIAPMMGYTNRHFRRFFREITRHTELYTEMITAHAVTQGSGISRFLDFSEQEMPLVLQLGGSDPVLLQQAVQQVESWNYAEINLNLGCPSDRVQSGKFGACLMKEPQQVKRCIAAMCSATHKPITAKTRIGVDELDSDSFLKHFVEVLLEAGCRKIILHARKAWLKGLTPKENRNVPPLCYERVYRIKEYFPECVIILNGGVNSLLAAQEHLRYVDGVMFGRWAYTHPFDFSAVDSLFYGKQQANQPTRKAIIKRYLQYCLHEISQGSSAWSLVRHLLPLFYDTPYAKKWRRLLSQIAWRTAQEPINILLDLLEKAAWIESC